MKLMLRPEWRLWPLSSFLGLLDLKTGVTVALLFAVRSLDNLPQSLIHPSLAFEQSRRCIRPHCCPNWRRRFFRSAQSLYIFRDCACRLDMGPTRSTRCTSIHSLPNLSLQLTITRRTRRRLSTLRIFSSQTTSSLLRGPCSLPLSGGFGPLMTAVDKPTLRRSKR